VGLVGIGIVDAVDIAVVTVALRIGFDPDPIVAGLFGLIGIDVLVALVLQ
jgi:hypothetical protein